MSMFQDPWNLSFTDGGDDKTGNSDVVTFLSSSSSSEDFAKNYVGSSTVGLSGSDTSSSAIREIEQQPVNQLMLISLLEHICLKYCDSDKEAQLLFQVLCEKLVAMKFIPNLKHLDEFKAIRSKYQESLAMLMQSSLEVVQKFRVKSMKPEKWAFQLSLTRSENWSTIKSHNNNQMSFENMFDSIQNIGQGGFGIVMKAKNKLDKRIYAVKRIPFAIQDTNKCLKTLREVRVLSNLYHRNIVRYHASWLEYDLFKKLDEGDENSSDTQEKMETETNDQCGQLNGQYLNGEFGYGNNEGACGSSSSKYKRSISYNSYQYTKDRINEINHCFMKRQNPFDQRYDATKRFSMAILIQMELCDMTLRRWLDERNNSSHQEVDWFVNINIMEQMFEGLQYIHENQLLHRDIKPDNIFINKTEGGAKLAVKIGDFGLARSDTQPRSPDIDMRSLDIIPFSESFPDEETHTMGVGTATYAAPEQRSTRLYTNKIDIYSAGIITYELFRIFSTQMERMRMIREVLNGDIETSLKRKWPEECDMILSMTKLDPDCRPSAKQLLANQIFSKERLFNEKYRLEIQEKEKEIERLRELLKSSKICEECWKTCNHCR